jgi:uncharacterized membrane protein
MTFPPASCRPGLRPSPALLLTAFLLLGGCGDAEAPEEAADAGGDAPAVARTPVPTPPSRVQTVRLHLGEAGELLVAPCVDGRGATLPPEAVPLVDATGQDLVGMVREFGSPELGVPALVSIGDGGVEALRIALPEGAACANLLDEGELVASGNEPFWHVRLSGDEITWRTPDDIDGVLYSEGSWRDEGDHWRYEALRDVVDGMDYLVLEVTDTPCSDSMSGARYPWTAAVERGGERWTGCAREGAGALGGLGRATGG